jgi:hypothetical protein
MMTTFNCPIPEMAPLGVPLNASAVEDVWNVLIKPIQDRDALPPSVEERALMAILRAVYRGLSDMEAGA